MVKNSGDQPKEIRSREGVVMKKIVLTGILFACVTVCAVAEEGFEGRPILNNVSMKTGYTLNKGEFTIGLGSIGFGITDNVQVGTNILKYMFQVYNGNLKVSLFKSDSMSLAAGMSLDQFNLNLLEDENSDVSFTSFSPYVSISPRLSRNLRLHITGQYSFFSGDINVEDTEVLGSISGTSFFGGLEYSFSNKTKFMTETGYDTTFDTFRVGGSVLFGWSKFRLKLGVNYFDPKFTGSFVFPVIGLWWRFGG